MPPDVFGGQRVAPQETLSQVLLDEARNRLAPDFVVGDANSFVALVGLNADDGKTE